jgi:hypothetical protein
MTMIGAMSCSDGALLLADGQETITDYAKWTTQKMKVASFHPLRVAMVGAGDADTIDMVWDKVSELWGGSGDSFYHGWNAATPKLSCREWRNRIVALAQDVCETTKIEVELIWVAQDSSAVPHEAIELFRTFGLRERNVRQYYFGGNPLLLSRYLSDTHLKNFHWTLEEARALATYLLWEAKERDPTVGKQSDIALFRRDGTAWLMDQNEVAYWEDHFRILKREMAILPILSCATGTTAQLHKLRDHIERLTLSVKVLAREQEKMRQGKRRSRRIDEVLTPQIRTLTRRQMNRDVRRMNQEPSMQSTPEKSKDQP